MDAPVPHKPSLLVLLVLSALLLAAAGSAAAAPAPAALTFEAEFEPEEGEFEEGEFAEEEPGEEFAEAECEIAEEELEEGLLTPADVTELCQAEEEELAAGTSTEGCPLRSAKVHASDKNNRLKLTIGYTAGAPTKARVEVLIGKRKFASYKRRLGRSGVIRVTKRLGKRRPKKIRVRFVTPLCNSFRLRPALVH